MATPRFICLCNQTVEKGQYSLDVTISGDSSLAAQSQTPSPRCQTCIDASNPRQTEIWIHFKLSKPTIAPSQLLFRGPTHQTIALRPLKAMDEFNEEMREAVRRMPVRLRTLLSDEGRDASEPIIDVRLGCGHDFIYVSDVVARWKASCAAQAPDMMHLEDIRSARRRKFEGLTMKTEAVEETSPEARIPEVLQTLDLIRAARVRALTSRANAPEPPTLSLKAEDDGPPCSQLEPTQGSLRVVRGPGGGTQVLGYGSDEALQKLIRDAFRPQNGQDYATL